MNNKEKYRHSIDKIEIREAAIQEAIKNARNYRAKELSKLERKNKFRIFRNAIITISTLLGLSAASYAGYVAYKNKGFGTMTYKNTTVVQMEGFDEVIDTIEHEGVYNNGIYYDIETPAEIVVTHEGTTDRYASMYNDTIMQNGQKVPEVYMDIKVLDTSEKEKTKEYYANQTSDVHIYTGTIGQDDYSYVAYSYYFGHNWDSEFHRVHVIDINEEKFMLIDVRTFIEATEGWDVRFGQLLDTLKIYVED